MFRFGLTGGIGSGKSTVAAMLQERGAVVIDADAQSRLLTAPGGAALAAIAQTFGSDMIGVDGGLHRPRMRERVFGDPAALARLEAILHPLIAQRMAQLEGEAAGRGVRCVVLDIPLLLESARWRPRLNRVLVIDCDPLTQKQRVQQRSGLDELQVQRIMDTQLDRWSRLRGADDVLYNGAGVELGTLRAHVAQWAGRFGL